MSLSHMWTETKTEIFEKCYMPLLWSKLYQTTSLKIIFIFSMYPNYSGRNFAQHNYRIKIFTTMVYQIYPQVYLHQQFVSIILWFISSKLSAWLSWWFSGKESIHLPIQETWVQFLGGDFPWRRKLQPTPVFLPRKAHGQLQPIGL